ncbi:MAG: hypothetical protein LUC97_09925 [Clostridiales bacterium]|nr:hypothetical protein [Clostridiales bacterium]
MEEEPPKEVIENLDLEEELNKWDIFEYGKGFDKAQEPIEERPKSENKMPEQNKPNKPEIIGNTTYQYIEKKTYRKFDNDTAAKIASAFEEAGLK